MQNSPRQETLHEVQEVLLGAVSAATREASPPSLRLLHPSAKQLGRWTDSNENAKYL